MSNIIIKNVTRPTRYQGAYYDSHLHAFRNPQKVIADFKVRYGKHPELLKDDGELMFYGDFSTERLAEDMKLLNCQGGIVKNIADIDIANPNDGKAIFAANNWAIETTKLFPHLFVFGSIHPQLKQYSGKSALAEIERLAENGIRGVSFDSCWQNFRPEASKMIPLYWKMAKLGLVALFHVGHDSGSKYPDNLTWAEHILEIHKARPELKIIACHLGPPPPEKKKPNLLGVDNIWLDTAYVPQFIESRNSLSRDVFLEIMERHGFNRILFGSDYPWTDPGFSIDFLCQLPISEENKRKILHDNFAELFGLPT